MRLVWAHHALADRDAIFKHIEAESLRAAVNVDDRIGGLSTFQRADAPAESVTFCVSGHDWQAPPEPSAVEIARKAVRPFGPVFVRHLRFVGDRAILSGSSCYKIGNGGVAPWPNPENLPRLSR